VRLFQKLLHLYKKIYISKSFENLFGKTKKFSLFRILVIPFVLQIIVIVALTSYVSYKSGQNAVDDLANQLMTEIGKRIDQNLSDYMQNIEKITMTNASLVQMGLLNPANQTALRQHFWEQLHNYELASTVAMASENRDLLALEKDNISFILREYDKTTRNYTSYRLSKDGRKTEQTGSIANFDPLNDPPHDPWYAKTKAQKGSTWILVVSMAKGLNDPELMVVNFLPIYNNQKNMLGVAASSIYLSQFGRFLKSLTIGQNGQAFVIDKQGLLIATSTGEIPFRQNKSTTYSEIVETENKRIAAIDSNNSITSAGIKAVISEYGQVGREYGQLGRITEPQQFSFKLSGTRYLLQIIPFKKANLELLSVIIVPETDFMAYINENVRYNIFFSILALAIAITIGIFTARWITAPILHLNTAARRMAKGEWDKPVTIERSDEIGELTESFNDMAAKLKLSFELLHKEIKERKQMEEAIRTSEERFRRLLLNVPAIAIQGYKLDGTTTYWNQASERLYGYTAEEAIGRNLLDLIIPPEIQKEVKDSIVCMSETGQPIPSAEVTLMKKDGSRVQVFSNHALVHMPGFPSELFCLDIDLTERKMAEEEIIREKEKLKILSDNAPFGMALISKDGQFTYINNKFTELYGYDISDIPDGRTWFKKAYPEEEYRHYVISKWKEDHSIAFSGEQRSWIFDVMCKDGSNRIVKFMTSMLISGECIVTAEDITEIRELESQLRQAQKTEALGTLAGGIAHDFNNILTALMGYATIIKMKMNEADPSFEYMEEVLTASKKLADLTQNLLIFSRQQPVKLEPMEINNEIKRTEKLLKRLLTEDIELHTRFTNEELIINADKTHLDQILFNLVANARDAMPKGGMLVVETEAVIIDDDFIRAHGFGEPGRFALIKISDTGMGMDEATREKIFDPFFTTKEVGKGTGLGLATVYGIVKKHGGYIYVDSVVNQGTAFHLYFPAVMTKANLYHDKTAQVQAKGGSETILVAEDNEDVRRFIFNALSQRGYKIIEATDGQDAIEQYKQHGNIDLIIIDSVMPKKNGREAFEEIQRINPNVKVIFTSGHTRDIVLEKGIEENVYDFIPKPLSLNALLLKIREVLDR